MVHHWSVVDSCSRRRGCLGVAAAPATRLPCKNVAEPGGTVGGTRLCASSPMHYSARSTAQILMFWGAAHCKGLHCTSSSWPLVARALRCFLDASRCTQPRCCQIHHEQGTAWSAKFSGSAQSSLGYGSACWWLALQFGFWGIKSAKKNHRVDPGRAQPVI